MAGDPRILQRGNLLQRLLGGLPRSDPRRATRSRRQGARRNFPRRALDQHFEAAAISLRAQDSFILQITLHARLLPQALHPPLQSGATEHRSRVTHYPDSLYRKGFSLSGDLISPQPNLLGSSTIKASRLSG